MTEPVAILRAQYAVARALAESGSLGEATPSILREVCAALAWDVGVLWRVDAASHELRFVDFWSRPGVKTAEFEAECRARMFGIGEGLPGRVLRDARPAWITDVQADPNFPRAPIAMEPGLRAAFAFPVRLGNHVFGVMEFFSRESREPDEELLSVMEGIGSQVGQYDVRRRAEAELADAHARLAQQHAALEDANRRLSELAITDVLTGIPNQRAFRLRLEALLAEGVRGRKFALAIADIDQFKLLNDAHGHPAGDDVLRAVATTLRDGLRRTDFVARYGGEEFAILLVDVDLEKAVEVVEVLRRRVSGIANPWRRVTASFGVADFGLGRNKGDSLFEAADKALYRAKRRGRNRVEAAPLKRKIASPKAAIAKKKKGSRRPKPSKKRR
ncbi:MAG: sensor domain-containing diguanylate cyclase [Planctomycetes bacterium]|nr:sensor domain-containing diguanylate cyclase [Planctomycetota bacterium]